MHRMEKAERGQPPRGGRPFVLRRDGSKRMSCVTDSPLRPNIVAVWAGAVGIRIFHYRSELEEMMKKLSLDLNALAVQSFATDDEAVPVFGTVHGRQGRGNTRIDDTDCSAVDACPSARGCTSHP
jgi:hypothetical protein